MRRMTILAILMILSVLSLRGQELYINLFQIDRQQCSDKPLLLEINFAAEYQNDTKAALVLSAQNGKTTLLWEKYALEPGFAISKKIPSHLLNEAPLKCYIFNPKKEIIKIDSLDYSIQAIDVPSYLPDNLQVKVFESEGFGIDNSMCFYSDDDNYLELGDESGIITKPISLYLNGDQYFEWYLVNADSKRVSLANENHSFKTRLDVVFDPDNAGAHFDLKAEFLENTEVSRFALIIPFTDNDFVVYRQNMRVDSAYLQDEYYLDHEGFSLKRGEGQLNLYHPKALSSIQLDVKNATAILNIDYEKDHLLIHYPAQTDTLEYYLDLSKRMVKAGEALTASFDISLTQLLDLPRIMPVWDGFESAIIFTEHADWTDIRTHRAVCFGSEDVVRAEDAVGGFVHYGVPVTKSVFYSNPDGVINLLKNRDFPQSHCTIKTDTAFFDFLKQLKDNGFEICLHTPEQYTATRDNLWEALAFMKEHFGSPSWIDHGYNNSYVNNREDLVCDGLNSKSAYYALDAWKANGVRYLWNAAYEEIKPFDDWKFGNSLQRPYPFWTDAMPKPRVMRAHFDKDIILWSTDYTLEPGELWDYYLSQSNLDVVVESRQAFITHVYSPWVTTERGFWDMEDGKIVAKNGLNKALERIANLRDRHLMLPTTVEKYLKYQEQLQNVEYQYDNENIVLINNNNDTIHGFSLISTAPVTVETRYGMSISVNSRESNGEHITWFDFAPKETIIIKQ